jgi:Recombination enhancement, RecA-dependent nuclease
VVGKTKAPNKDEARRMDLIGGQYFGCIPCLKHDKFSLATVQHVTAGFKRLGHRYTYGCCPWHHFGTPFTVNDVSLTRLEMEDLIGPSLAFNRRAYKDFYGSEELLIAVQDWLIECYDANPWPDYLLPAGVAAEARRLLDAM